MLFPDVSCTAENTLNDHLSRGLYEIIKVDWVGIVTLTKTKKIYIDGKINFGNIDDEDIETFLNKHKEDILNDFKAKVYKQEFCDFLIMPIRSDLKYVVMYVFCNKDKIFKARDLEWLQVYCKLSYENTLNKNEIIQVKNYTENVFDSTESAVIAFNLEGYVIAANKAVVNTFGLREEVLFGRHYFDYFKLENRNDFIDEMNYVIETGKKKHLKQIFFSSQNSERILNAVLSPLRNSKGIISGVVLVGTDITERSIIEHEISQTKQFALLGKIAAGIAHDVKNPLMNIKGCSRIMMKNNETDNNQKELTNIIIHEVDRINKVIEQMLFFGKITKDHGFTFLNINETIKDCVQIINRQKFGKTIEVLCQLEDNIPYIYASNLNIQQVLLNVLINSIEAIENEGYIKISSKYNNDETIQVIIEDNGVGIDNKSLNKIFNPYYSNKSKGSGLGLFVAKRVLNEYKATIDISSVNGEGTRIEMEFSCAKEGIINDKKSLSS